MEIAQFAERPRPCTYLPGLTASLEYRVFDELTAAEFQPLLERGWRRFGCYCFRPACTGCAECRSIRVDAARFRPSKSQRRSLARNRNIRVEWGPRQATVAHADLLNAWQAEMSRRKGWPPVIVDRGEYAEGFVGPPCAFAGEGRYFDGGRLVGVDLVDWLPGGLSSAYFYYDPAWRPLGPGVFSVLQEIEFCRAHGLPHLYLGYWIAACLSMSYKSQFRPHELLAGRPDDDEKAVWKVVGVAP